MAYIAIVALCYALLLSIRKLSPRLGLCDCAASEERKLHAGYPAQVGGIAIFLALLTGTALFSPGSLPPTTSLFVSMGLLVLIGAIDDSRHIPALKKLLLQCAVICLLVLIFDVRIITLGQIGGIDLILPNFISYSLSIICFLAFINAFNLVDGMDGLSGGIAMINVLFFLFLDLHNGAAAYVFPLTGLALCLGCFLTMNMRSPWRRKALVFLGDAGSLSIGLALAWFGITFSQGENAVISPALVPWLLAYPVFDMTAVIINRLLHKTPVLRADNMHLHFLVQQTGLSVHKSCLFLLGLSLLYSLTGLAAWKSGLTDLPLLALWAFFFGFHFLITRAIMERGEKKYA